MRRYKVKFPFVPDMGSISDMIVTETPIRTKEEEALWELNSMRDHDGQEHLKSLPRGVKFARLEDEA